jgi:hypothetical protein
MWKSPSRIDLEKSQSVHQLILRTLTPRKANDTNLLDVVSGPKILEGQVGAGMYE